MIKGVFIGDWPYVGGRLSLSRLQLGPTPVSLMLDTGADMSLVHPGDARRLGIDFDSHFQGVQRIKIGGVGTAEAYLEQMTLELPHLNGSVDRFAGGIFVAVPSDINRQYPSILGRDVFDHYSIIYSKARNLLILQ